MSVLHVLLSPPRPDGDVALRRWMARGDRLPDLPAGREALVRQLFRFAGETVPVAALRHHAHADDATGGSWLCADPAYVRSEATGARLMGWPLPDISSDEAKELASALMPLFGDAGMPLVVDTPSSWCLRLGDGATDASFTSPRHALGADLLACLPAGEKGRRWRRLFNEAQVALHAHPANAARAAEGREPVNALWFWGAGPLPAAVESGLVTVATRDDVIRGLARLARIAVVEPAPEALETSASGSDALLDLQTTTVNSIDWLPFFEQALRRNQFDAIELTFPGGERFRVRHAHRLRFWRRG